ncbi:protein-L-isoaspartate O-methyltransferase family protein [Mesorhizobium marinum]|uniref:protein-L-isoaspartate O-methyltransferase family protein n=1 Tax=Mesorhizobium marinum TaxID=3228790 RepID=UPI003466BD44
MTADFAELRVKMVDGQLRTTDVTNLPLLTAMLEVPREDFVPDARKALAYIDDDILLTDRGGPGARYLMEPSPFAKLAQLAEIGPRDRVLDVGAGTGYSAAVLSRLAGSVVALESDSPLAQKAEATLAQLGYDNVSVVRGALEAGHPQGGPYDVIVVEGSVEALPDALLGQLAEGGRLAVVEGHGHAGAARLYLKADGVATGRKVFNAAVKPLPGFERVREFEF